MPTLTAHIGTCERCHSPLEVSGQSIRCAAVNCGHIHADHPMLKKGPEKPPLAPEIPPADYPATDSQRLRALEKTVGDLTKRIASLEKRK